MGCLPSKAKDEVTITSNPRDVNSKAADKKPECSTAAQLNHVAATTKTTPLKNFTAPGVVAPLTGTKPLAKIKRGYSSGESSGTFSDDETDKGTSRVRLDTTDTDLTNRSMHGVLGLSDLRRSMLSDGDLARTVVRLETPFGIPIEEIYSGVHDGKVLGSGVSGVVRVVVHKATGIKYAVKCLDVWMINSVEGLKQLRDEISIMCQLDHPNIVRIEEVYESTNEIFIVQELCLGGDLYDRLDEQPDFHYTEAQCARIVKQMLSSLRYLHSKGIIHRDLKLENFLFNNSKSEAQLKMIDFGLSKHFELGQCHKERVGTPYTVAPEIIKGSYDEKSDIWSIGVISYLLLSGETPFGGLDGESLMLVRQQIMKADVKFTPVDVWEKVSADGKSFVKRMLNADPVARPSAKEAQRDPWISVWAKKDATEGKLLSDKTLTALMAFKEASDMQKLLSEVLSFTLLPEQIEELREDFEKIDPDGDGEITLEALKSVLMENAGAGALGSLTEEEIVEIFDAIRVRKTEPTIRWHEFLAAGLSQAKVDDRNLRLAFDRLDTQHKGFLTFDDLQDVLGSFTGDDNLERIWMDSLTQCGSKLDRITFAEFKLLMKGQTNNEQLVPSMNSSIRSSTRVTMNLPVLLEDDKPNDSLSPNVSCILPDEEMPCRTAFPKKRAQSLSEKGLTWSDSSAGSLTKPSGSLLSHGRKQAEEIIGDKNVSPLISNRTLYRKHREMRMAVLEATKQFDKKRNDVNAKNLSNAGLIMKRGTTAPSALEDAHAQALFEEAAKRCGRSRRTRNKTVSDVTEMLNKASK